MTEKQTATAFTLEVNLDGLAGEIEPELSRILRYWAGNLKHYNLEPGASEMISDSAYASVGMWKVS